jgi:hypothetical protein
LDPSEKPAAEPQKVEAQQQPAVALRTAVPIAKSAGKEVKAMKPFNYEAQVETFKQLQTKVFMSESEKTARHDLLFDRDLLKALGQRLVESSKDTVVHEQQDAAIDMLLAALKEGDKTAASAALQAVVQDKQIEDTGLERSAREQLAGLKAEILYQWSATQPDMTASIVAWLPGPVSQKIWQNVLRMQQSNQAESQTEVDAHGKVAH